MDLAFSIFLLSRRSSISPNFNFFFVKQMVFLSHFFSFFPNQFKMYSSSSSNLLSLENNVSLTIILYLLNVCLFISSLLL